MTLRGDNGRQRQSAAEIDIQSVDTWLFDLDNTLYPSRCNLFAQIDKKMGEFIENFFQIDAISAKKRQKDYFHRYGTTLRGLMTEHRMDPAEFLHHVHDIDVSALPPDPDLARAMGALPGRKMVFTNGTVPHAERILKQLRIDHHFDAVFDIVASEYIPKPDMAPYRKLLAEHGVDPARTVMFEDMAKNLRPAATLGMTTVWVVNERDWAQPTDGPDGDHVHIHHTTDNLGRWLCDLLPNNPGLSV